MGRVRRMVPRPHRGCQRRDQGQVRVRLRRLPSCPSNGPDRVSVPCRRVAAQGGRAHRARPVAGARRQASLILGDVRMGPRFDPAVVEVLEAFGQRLPSGAESAISAREVRKTPSLEPNGARAREILKQLVSEGLLAESGPGGRETSGTYSLTSLGRSRIEQRKRKEED